MKVEVKGDNDVVFKEMEATIVSLTDVKTTFGDKVIATLNNGKADFNVFLNNYSMEKLIKAYGKDDEKFIGKVVKLSLETDKNFGKKMIVLNPKA